MPLPRTAKSRNQHAETRRLLAGIKVSVPGRGTVTVAQMLRPVSASDDDPTIRGELACGLERLFALLSPLPPAARDEAVKKIAEFITDAARAAREQPNPPGTLV